MGTNYKRIVLCLLIFTAAVIGGCSGKSVLDSPLSNFSPEIINNPDAFSFQITDASNVTATVTYDWVNTGTQAVIDHSTSTTAGSASMRIIDADSLEVYTSGLVASANESSSAGTAGNWKIQLTFVNYSGTSNFRVDKL